MFDTIILKWLCSTMKKIACAIGMLKSIIMMKLINKYTKHCMHGATEIGCAKDPKYIYIEVKSVQL